MASPAKYSPFRELERQYDPIRQVYRDPSVETRAQQLEAARQQQVVARSQARLQRNEHFFSLLSHIPDPSPPRQTRPTLRSSVSYDIISAVSPSPPQAKGTVITSPVQRPFDIVTGLYHRDNDRKVQEEFLKSKLEAVDKYWKTREFQPILGKFVDKSQDERVREVEMERRERTLEKRRVQLPLSYQVHDMYYKNPAVNIDTSPLPDAHRKRYEVKYFMEKEVQKRNEVAERKKLLGLGVVSIEKITGGSRHNTNPFLTAERSPNTSMYTGKVWERLQSDSHSGVRLGWH